MKVEIGVCQAHLLLQQLKFASTKWPNINWLLTNEPILRFLGRQLLSDELFDLLSHCLVTLTRCHLVLGTWGAPHTHVSQLYFTTWSCLTHLRPIAAWRGVLVGACSTLVAG